MSYQLTNLINGLEQAEIRNFKLQMNRYKGKYTNKKLTELFDLLRKSNLDEYSDELRERIMPEGNKNAFYRLKNRLIEELENSLVYLHRNKDEEFGIYKNLQLYQRSFIKNDYKTAQLYLKKAEKTALELENYNQLVVIYRKHVQLSQYQNQEPAPFIEKQEYFRRLARENDRIDQLLSVINYQLKQTNFSGKDLKVNDILQEAYETVKINAKELAGSKRNRLAINQCVREILLQKKEFGVLSDFLIQNYKQSQKAGGFNKNNHEEKIKQISWIINALSKAKAFDQLSLYIDELHVALNEFNKVFYDKYIWLYYQSKVILFTTTLNTQPAIDLLLDLEQRENLQFNSAPFFFVYVNLITLLYTNNQLEKSLDYLAKIIVNAEFNNLSPNWKLSLQILELIIRIDNGDQQYSLSRVAEVKRKYKSLLQKETYQQERNFVQLLSSLTQKPAALKDESTRQKIQHFIDNSPSYELGSNELISYPIWLKAKLQKKRYQDLIGQDIH